MRLLCATASALTLCSLGALAAGEASASAAERQLTAWPGTEDHPRFSPDGEWLAFDATVEGRSDLYLMRLADGEIRRLTDTPHGDRRPVWSPDGQTIAYQSTRDGVTGIWSIPAAGGKPTAIFHRKGVGAIAPDFGPDGRLVATIIEPDPSRTYGHVTPWVMNADGSGARSLATPGDEWYARWDATGDWLYFYYGTDDGIGAVSPDTGEVRDITQGRFVGWRPMPSPDGEHLAFVSSPAWTAWLWRLDGTAPPVQLTQVGNDDFPAFSPDGSAVVFSADRAPNRLMEIDLDSGVQRQLAVGTDPYLTRDGRISYLSDDKPSRVRALVPASGEDREVRVDASMPVWAALSPSGNRMAVVGLGAHGERHLLLGADGGDLRQYRDFDRVEYPRWCGQEDSLLLSSDHDDAFHQLRQLDLRTGEMSRLTDSPGSKLITACAEDRNWISYRYMAGRVGAGVLDRVGEGWQVRFETGGLTGALSPDGSSFAEVRAEGGQIDLFLRSADGNYVRLTNDRDIESSPGFTADGRRVVYVSRTTNRDLWLVDVSQASGNRRR